MFARRTDLPLDRDALSRFLPWIIAFMAYLAVLALAGALILHDLAERWDRGVSATMTVQIPSSDDAAEDKERIKAVIARLRAMPDVLDAEAMDEERLARLLEPWLGTTATAGDLPLPHLVDVELKTGAGTDAQALAAKLATLAPGITVDDHGIWLERLVRLVRATEFLASVVLVLMGFATVGTVVFTTRTGLAIHQDVIEVLHLIGARDAYVARQFAGRALSLGLRGGCIGLALAVATLLGVGSLAARLEAGLLPDISLTFVNWILLAAIPLVVAVIAMVTARLTVIRTLTRML